MMNNIWRDQIFAAGIEGFNHWKEQSIQEQLKKFEKEYLKARKQQNINFENALEEVNKVREFLSNDKHILGSKQTKHGEIAEYLEVHIRNAKVVLMGEEKVASFEGVGRTAPEDFILNANKFQSKFFNGVNSTLEGLLNHFDKYKDNSMNYSIPKDQYQVIEAIQSGAFPEHLSMKKAFNILTKVKEIENQTGKSFYEIVKPSISDYDEVQLGKAGETILKYQSEIVDENQEIQNNIQKRMDRKKDFIESGRDPSFTEGGKVVGSAAVGSLAIKTITLIYKKMKLGKDIQDFNENDWKEIGLNAGKAGTRNGVVAGSIYTLTNLTSLSAPFAGAVTSASIGLTSLLTDLQSEQISINEFVTDGQILCIEAGIAAIGVAIGQMSIPVPVLGSIIGTVATNFLWNFVKGKLGEREKELKALLDSYIETIYIKTNEVYQTIIDKINETYSRYNSLIDAAFDLNMNSEVLAAASVDLAIEIGVEKQKILKTDNDLKAFFLE